MKYKIISIIILININFYIFAQKVHNFYIPDKIPEKVEQFVVKHAHEILNLLKLKKLTVSFLVNDNDIYEIEFLQNNELIYYDSYQGKTLPAANFKTTNTKSLGTQNIPLGWFRDLSNFGGASEQPHHQIEIGKSGYYWEFNVINKFLGGIPATILKRVFGGIVMGNIFLQHRKLFYIKEYLSHMECG